MGIIDSVVRKESDRMNRKQMVDQLRKRIINDLKAVYEENGEEVLNLSGNEFCFPCVENGEDFYVKVKVTIPNDKFDGYMESEGFQTAQKLKEEKAKAKADKLKKLQLDKK